LVGEQAGSRPGTFEFSQFAFSRALTVQRGGFSFGSMRTTLELPGKVYEKAKALAQAEGAPLETILSQLVQRGLESGAADKQDEHAQILTYRAVRPVTAEDTQALDGEL